MSINSAMKSSIFNSDFQFEIRWLVPEPLVNDFRNFPALIVHFNYVLESLIYAQLWVALVFDLVEDIGEVFGAVVLCVKLVFTGN